MGDRDGNVNADLSDINLRDKLFGGGSVPGEDGGAVSVGVPVNKRDGLLQGVDVEDTESVTENLLLVSSHVCVHVVDDGGTNEVAVGILGHCQATSVQQQIGTLINS